jgi:hypothetical protein
MKLIAKTRLTHRPKKGEASIIIEPGQTFELDDQAARVLIEQNEAAPAPTGRTSAPSPAK